MPTPVKALLYFAVLLALMLIVRYLPRDSQPLPGLLAVLAVVWMFSGVFIVFRGIYRFITR